MAGVTDLLSTAQNIVSAINGWATTLRSVNGVLNAPDLTAATLVRSGEGRLVAVSVIDGGSADGYIYDANISTATTAPIYLIPQTAGVYVVNMPVSNGIVVAPGTGQRVTVSYS